MHRCNRWQPSQTEVIALFGYRLSLDRDGQAVELAIGQSGFLDRMSFALFSADIEKYFARRVVIDGGAVLIDYRLKARRWSFPGGKVLPRHFQKPSSQARQLDRFTAVCASDGRPSAALIH